jgi:predicted HicB family RNase H-like nuclease
MRQTKTPVTVRLTAELLAEVRACAARDNRSLTNYIETALRHRVGASERHRQGSAVYRAHGEAAK